MNEKYRKIKMWEESLEKIKKEYLRYLSLKIKFVSWAPVLFFSAKTGKGTGDIFESAERIFEERNRRVGTAELNRFLPEILFGHVMPTIKTKQGKLKYASQVAVNPPKFIFSVNREDAFHYSYRRYLENQIRKKYGFHGTPIILELRETNNRDPKK